MEMYLEPTKDWLRVSQFQLRVLSLESKRGCLRVTYWVTVHW